MNKTEIELPLEGYENTKELSFTFRKAINERGFSAHVNVWVDESDSVSAMQTQGIQNVKRFLADVLKDLESEYPE